MARHSSPQTQLCVFRYQVRSEDLHDMLYQKQFSEQFADCLFALLTHVFSHEPNPCIIGQIQIEDGGSGKALQYVRPQLRLCRALQSWSWVLTCRRARALANWQQGPALQCRRAQL